MDRGSTPLISICGLSLMDKTTGFYPVYIGSIPIDRIFYGVRLIGKPAVSKTATGGSSPSPHAIKTHTAIFWNRLLICKSKMCLVLCWNARMAKGADCKSVMCRFDSYFQLCGNGGTGRRTSLRNWREVIVACGFDSHFPHQKLKKFFFNLD